MNHLCRIKSICTNGKKRTSLKQLILFWEKYVSNAIHQIYLTFHWYNFVLDIFMQKRIVCQGEVVLKNLNHVVQCSIYTNEKKMFKNNKMREEGKGLKDNMIFKNNFRKHFSKSYIIKKKCTVSQSQLRICAICVIVWPPALNVTRSQLSHIYKSHLFI